MSMNSISLTLKQWKQDGKPKKPVSQKPVLSTEWLWEQI